MKQTTFNLLVECELATAETADIAKHSTPAELKRQIACLGRLSQKVGKHLREDLKDEELTA